jgi:hypothetical protein
MSSEPSAELSPAYLARLAAECRELCRQSDELISRSRVVIATAEIAARRGRDAVGRARGHTGGWYVATPAA